MDVERNSFYTPADIPELSLVPRSPLREGPGFPAVNKHFPEAPSFASRPQPGIQDPPAATKWMKISLSIWDGRNQPPSVQPLAQDPQADENGNVKVTAQVKSTTSIL